MYIHWKFIKISILATQKQPHWRDENNKSPFPVCLYKSDSHHLYSVISNIQMNYYSCYYYCQYNYAIVATVATCKLGHLDDAQQFVARSSCSHSRLMILYMCLPQISLWAAAKQPLWSFMDASGTLFSFTKHFTCIESCAITGQYAGACSKRLV